jgi:hypothetical protein
LALAAKPFFDPGRESTRRQTGNLHLAFKARDTYRATIREAHIVFDLAQASRRRIEDEPRSRDHYTGLLFPLIRNYATDSAFEAYFPEIRLSPASRRDEAQSQRSASSMARCPIDSRPWRRSKSSS